MTSLPAEVPRRVQHLAHVVNAYNICLRLEKSLRQIGQGEEVGNKLIYIRILGYLVHNVPGDRALKTVIDEISSCCDDSALLDLGKMYYDHYLRAFRAKKGRIPTPSNHVSRPSFDTIADMMNDTLLEAPQSHSSAKKLALIRDGHRCIVSGQYDDESVTKIQELANKVALDPSLMPGPTQCLHIFSEFTNASSELGSSKRDYAATMWAIMNRFGHNKFPDELNGPKVHRLENVMTLSVNFHLNFDNLKIWFLATNEKNKYKLEAADAFRLRPYPKYVTFTTPDPVNLPVPSPAYLAIHAACAKIAHLSGAAECIDKFNRDMDDSTTLDPNGASAALLEHAMFELQASA